jgi:putative ABC transport system substrate-binding protein
MRRRDFLILLAGAIGGGQSTVRAQQKAMPVIGILGATSPENPLVAANLVGFRRGLGETEYVEGQNVTIEYRWANGEYDRLPVLAADLVGRKVNAIAALSVPSALAARSATFDDPDRFQRRRRGRARPGRQSRPAGGATSRASASSPSNCCPSWSSCCPNWFRRPA